MYIGFCACRQPVISRRRAAAGRHIAAGLRGRLFSPLHRLLLPAERRARFSPPADAAIALLRFFDLILRLRRLIY